MEGPAANIVIDGKLVPFSGHAKKSGTRCVLISDTHLVHDQMILPPGDVLVHSGDVLTESLLRHVEDGTPKAKGVELFDLFAKWFCKQPHPFKGVSFVL